MLRSLKLFNNPSVTTFKELAKLFFGIHDPTQFNRQGPDVGEQYRSAIFYKSDKQRETAEKLIELLKQKGYELVTKLVEAGEFWEAEVYHQRYYEKKNDKPYCHLYRNKF